MGDDHLTKVPGLPSRASVVPGMAHFPGTGPLGTTCGDCFHRGYKRTGQERWDTRAQMFVARLYKTNACQMFKRLTGKHGPAIVAGNASCRHFAQRDKT